MRLYIQSQTDNITFSLKIQLLKQEDICFTANLMHFCTSQISWYFFFVRTLWLKELFVPCVEQESGLSCPVGYKDIHLKRLGGEKLAAKKVFHNAFKCW